MKNRNSIFHRTTVLCLLFTASFFISCEKAFEFELPASNSKADTELPSASFSYIPDGEAFNRILFTDLSTESTDYLWDFGGGVTSTERDPVHTFAGEGVFPVTLKASDKNGASDQVTIDVVVQDLFVPITPEVINGDMEDSSNGWKIDFSNGWSNNGFESSSDGSWLKYDGTDNGAKTRGAKWNMKRSAAEWATTDTRHAYQALVVSPNVKYVLEFEYAIKDDDGTDPIGGRRIMAEILDGHFTDGVDALNSSLGGEALLTHTANEVKGKTVFTTVKAEFTSGASGEISIWIWAVTPVDCYVDNVKVYPAN